MQMSKGSGLCLLLQDTHWWHLCTCLSMPDTGFCFVCVCVFFFFGDTKGKEQESMSLR